MAARDTARPNILFILADDLGHWALGCAGNTEIRTPHLDRLAEGGLRFDNFFCVSPVCSPARASLLTGQIPSRHGVHDWLRAGNTVGDYAPGAPAVQYLQGQETYTALLAQSGYNCGLSGKWHLGDSHQPQQGFSFWAAHAAGGGNYYEAPLIADGAVYSEPRYVTDVITDNALKFLVGQAEASAPFYLGVNYTAPHSPWERAQHPAALWDDYHANCPFQSVPSEPMHPWQINSAPYGFDAATRREILSGYYTAVTAMDENIGRLLAWLDAHGQRDNTLVIFTSDNGMNMGHHGIYGKGNGTLPQNMYDSSVKVPFIIAHPGRVPAGQVSDSLLSHYDVMPTLLAYAGIADPHAALRPGRSFAPLLRGNTAAQDEVVVVFDEYGPVRMIRTRAWNYVHRFPDGPHELYDMARDPGETVNRIDDAACATTLQELRESLATWFDRYVDPARDGAGEPVTGMGQLALVGVTSQSAERYATDWHYLTGHTGRE